MASYTLYVAIMAIASITLLQEVNCVLKSSKSCGDFRSRIWNEAFSNPQTMSFTTFTFETAKKLSTDEVCSDTYRSLFKFIEMTATSETAHYTLRMVHKMILAVLMEATAEKGNYKQTVVVLKRIYTEKNIGDFVLFYAKEWLKLLSNRENRTKLFKLLKGMETLTKPTQAEVQVKQTFKRIQSYNPFRRNK